MKVLTTDWIESKNLSEEDISIEDIEKLLDTNDIMIYKSPHGQIVLITDERGKKFRMR